MNDTTEPFLTHTVTDWFVKNLVVNFVLILKAGWTVKLNFFR